MGYKDNTSIDSYKYASSPATPQVNPDNTYATDALDGTVTRTDTTSSPFSVYFTTAATPLIPRGTGAYNLTTGTLRINVGNQATPVWRSITNS